MKKCSVCVCVCVLLWKTKEKIQKYRKWKEKVCVNKPPHYCDFCQTKYELYFSFWNYCTNYSCFFTVYVYWKKTLCVCVCVYWKNWAQKLRTELHVCVSIFLSVCLSICLSVRPSVRASFRWFACLCVLFVICKSVQRGWWKCVSCMWCVCVCVCVCVIMEKGRKNAKIECVCVCVFIEKTRLKKVGENWRSVCVCVY